MELKAAIETLKSWLHHRERLHTNGILLVDGEGMEDKAKYPAEKDILYQALLVAIPILESAAKE